MTLELVPLVLAVFVALVGLGLVADGWLSDSTPRIEERRRRQRAERDRVGETLIGVGMLALAAALAGRDVWRWGTVAVLAGVVLLLAGTVRNRAYLAERLLHRGKTRRGRRRERRAEQAAERPVPLVVAADGDRRGRDRRDVVDGPPGARVARPAAEPRSPVDGQPGRPRSDRPVARRAVAD
jgi:hypothetical protein